MLMNQQACKFMSVKKTIIVESLTMFLSSSLVTDNVGKTTTSGSCMGSMGSNSGNVRGRKFSVKMQLLLQS